MTLRSRTVFAAACAFSKLWRSESELVGGAILPHGDFAYDPSVVNFSNGSVELHQASLLAGAFVITTLQPDVVFMTTPHGIELGDEFVVYENTAESGSAPVGDDVPHHDIYNVTMALQTDVEFAKGLRKDMQKRSLPVTGIEAFSDRLPLPLSWGEILPMTYLNHSLPKGHVLPRVVLMGIPYKRFNHSTDMVPALLDVGSAASQYFESTKARVAWLVSADLAHTHQASGPYGYCPCAELFDKAAGLWIKSLNSTALLHDATEQQKAGASACGYTGLVMLEGAVAGTGRASWKSNLLASAAPTYYGMAVATLARTNRSQLVVV
mmetsp:Transcript_38918/g.70861  ORF Transcript_38918/g.70861 Transcript_38918/m.70861 type:complete len:323 (+) Transcript_38918:74-1042(+)